MSKSSSGAMSPSGITCPVSAKAARIPGTRHVSAIGQGLMSELGTRLP